MRIALWLLVPGVILHYFGVTPWLLSIIAGLMIEGLLLALKHFEGSSRQM